MSFPVTLTFDIWPLDLKFAPLVILVQCYVSTTLEVSMAFLFRENRRHVTDRRTDKLSAMLNAALREGGIKIQKKLKHKKCGPRYIYMCDSTKQVKHLFS